MHTVAGLLGVTVGLLVVAGAIRLATADNPRRRLRARSWVTSLLLIGLGALLVLGLIGRGT